MNKKPRITETAEITRSRLFSIEAVQLEFANGEQREYERINAPGTGAVMVAPVTDDGRLILIREYAVGTDRYELLFPKGRIDDGESIEHAANRELREEIGLGARQLQRLRPMTIAPGYLGFTTHLVLARELYQQPLAGDEPEPLETVYWELDKMESLMQHPELTEARTIAALYLVRDQLEP